MGQMSKGPRRTALVGGVQVNIGEKNQMDPSLFPYYWLVRRRRVESGECSQLERSN